MSLETALERNTAALMSLLTALQELKFTAAAPQTSAPPAAEPGSASLSTAPDIVDIESLTTEQIVMLAVLHGDAELTVTQQLADDAQHKWDDQKNGAYAVDPAALYMAVTGVPAFTVAYKRVQLQICCQLCNWWNELPTIDTRRDYAAALMRTSPLEMAGVKPPKKTARQTEKQVDEPAPTESQPDFVALREQAKNHILSLAKAGRRAEAVSLLNDFGAVKLPDVRDDALPALVAEAEKLNGGANV